MTYFVVHIALAEGGFDRAFVRTSVQSYEDVRHAMVLASPFFEALPLSSLLTRLRLI